MSIDAKLPTPKDEQQLQELLNDVKAMRLKAVKGNMDPWYVRQALVMGLEFDTLVRHGVNVVAVMGNNGIWGLEKHPMEFLYGYSVAAELRPETRYDEVVAALGGNGELVAKPAELRPALERALAADAPALVNVLTDPSVAYPRKANLA